MDGVAIGVVVFTIVTPRIGDDPPFFFTHPNRANCDPGFADFISCEGNLLRMVFAVTDDD